VALESVIAVPSVEEALGFMRKFEAEQSSSLTR